VVQVAIVARINNRWTWATKPVGSDGQGIEVLNNVKKEHVALAVVVILIAFAFGYCVDDTVAY
jgi:hypothetical protein